MARTFTFPQAGLFPNSTVFPGWVGQDDSQLDQLLVSGLGSTDWSGGVAPAGGTHTGTATITMIDGTRFAVASARAEVLRKLDRHAVAPTSPAWVAFDVPSSAVPLVLNASNVASVV